MDHLGFRIWHWAAIFCISATATVAAPLDYKRDIMPIFEEKCFKCHSEAEKVKGGLRLDDPEAFYKRFAKNNVVVPGDWDGSYLFVTVARPPGSKDSMPPKAKKGDGKSLTPEEVMKVAEWIYEGARIAGEKGDKGSKDDKPADFIKFKDGVMLTDGVGVHPAEDGDEEADEEMGMKAPPATEKPREWVNAEGVKITAAYKGIEGDKVLFVLKTGKTVKYPIKKLSKESRVELKKLFDAAKAKE